MIVVEDILVIKCLVECFNLLD